MSSRAEMKTFSCIFPESVLYCRSACRCDGMVDVVDSKSTASDGVPVRVRSPAPNQYNPNQVFPVGDGFGLFVFFKSFEETHVRNGVVKRAESKSRGVRK